MTRGRKRLMWGGLAVTIVVSGGVAIADWTGGNNCEVTSGVRPRNPMKALVYCDYGSADVLQFADVERPALGDDHVQVRVRAAAVNPLDWHFMHGTPYIMRVGTGLRKPKVTRLGVDFAGTVEAVGKNVSRFKRGDEVFGGRTGAYAEYVSVREDGALTLKPANMTFEEAASVPIAAVTALQGLRDKAHVQPGQTVLINGASGGVGTFAVQIAKALGANVTGVCSTSNVNMVRSIGADAVIDYTREDFTTGGRHYDVVIDNVGNRSLMDVRRILNPRGIYVLIGGGGPNDGRWIGPLASPVKEFLLSPFVSQDFVMLMAELNAQDLAVLRDLMLSGKVRPVVDRRYSFEQIPAAIQYLEAGHARGKVVISFN